MLAITYTCTACGGEFTLRQDSPEPDADVTYCPGCIDVMFSSDAHGTLDDPWTPELIRQARSCAD